MPNLHKKVVYDLLRYGWNTSHSSNLTFGPRIVLFWWKCCKHSATSVFNLSFFTGAWALPKPLLLIMCLQLNWICSNTCNNFSYFSNFQCILTRADHELFYSGENAAGIVQPQSLTCPFCGRLGFTEASLVDHVSSAHSDSSHDSQEVICPICASTPGGDPNHVLTWSDFSTHINLEHRSTGQRDLISFLDEPSRSGAGVRRVPHSRGGGSNGSG